MNGGAHMQEADTVYQVGSESKKGEIPGHASVQLVQHRLYCPLLVLDTIFQRNYRGSLLGMQRAPQRVECSG